MNLKIAICDDDKIICSHIESMILQYAKSSSFTATVSVFFDGHMLMEDIRSGRGDYDLIYLDIEMNEVNGVEVGLSLRGELRDHKIQIIYVSGTGQYDRQLFDVQPLLFISKPIEENLIGRSLDLAIEKLELVPKLYHYKKRKEHFSYRMEEILYFENSGRKVNIITVDGRDSFVDNIRDVAKEVMPFGFIKISQSIIVNYLFVSKYSREEIILLNKEIIAIPKNKRNEVKEQFLRESDRHQ
ncbi:LytR/AlgR family response regulator transcription factor [Carnobacterium gallinarum]|uniref:LytR/AlgR family response regulator transcription factor n=1 Tax=Carnobacterium gallinarum TaxID=2749 RepID=UPI00055940B1|nr:LytTR family DNA-binding domain-containing protein [Carnobacterium gallinarum]